MGGDAGDTEQHFGGRGRHAPLELLLVDLADGAHDFDRGFAGAADDGDPVHRVPVPISSSSRVRSLVRSVSCAAAPPAARQIDVTRQAECPGVARRIPHQNVLLHEPRPAPSEYNMPEILVLRVMLAATSRLHGMA